MSPSAQTSRIESLDELRGFLIFILIAADFLAGYTFVPGWFKHSNVFGAIRLIDLGAPLFIFCVGVSLGLVFLRCRNSDEVSAATWRYIRRGFVLIAFGVIGSTLLHKGIIRDWEIFQTIGLAGIIAIPFITLPYRTRIGAALLLMLTFQAIARSEYGNWLRTVDIGGLGGMLGSIGWASLILIGSTISPLLRSGGKTLRSRLLTVGIVAVILALAIVRFQPFDKRLVTASYLALTTSLAAFALLLFVELTDRRRFHFWPFTVFGANALTTFILHGLIILLLTAIIPSSSTMGVVLTALVAFYAVCYAVAGWLYHRRIFIRL